MPVWQNIEQSRGTEYSEAVWSCPFRDLESLRSKVYTTCLLTAADHLNAT